MAKDLTLNVVVRKDDKALAELATEFQAVATEAEASGKKINTSLKSLVDNKLKDSQKQLQSLKAEFAKGGNIALIPQIRALEKELRNLDKAGATLKTTFGNAGPGAESLLAKALQFGGPAAPILAPAAGGLILGALGVGTIGAGIVGQLHSSQVQAALAQFKTDAGATFAEATTPFKGVLTRELAAADDLVQKVAPELTEMFDKAAPAADAFFKGINGFVEEALPGLNKGLDGANIVITELGKDLPRVGKAIGDAFAGAAGGAKGDAQALHDLLTVTDQLITASGQLAGESGRLYEQLRSIATLNNSDGQLSWKNLQKTFNAFTTAGIEPLLEHLFHMGDSSKEAAYQVDNLGKSLNDLGPDAKTSADALRYLDGELDSLISKQLTLDQANDKFKEDLLGLKDQLDKNSRSIDDNSLAGLHNRDVLLGLIADAEQARQAAIDHAGGVNASKAAVDQANASYQAAIDQLVGVASQAGISRDALNKLAGNYQINVLLAVDAVLKSGLAQNVSAHDPNRYGSAGPPKRAAGGPVTAGQPYIVGEQRPELFVPNVNGTIIPKLPGPMSYATGTAGRSSGQPTVNVTADNNAVAAALAPVVAYMLRVGAIRLTVSNGAVSAV